MNRLSSVLSVRDVVLDFEATTPRALFEHAGRLFEAGHGIDGAAVAQTLIERERLGSTGLGHGVAIPHGRIKGLKEPAAALIRLRDPIAFDAPDGERARLFVFLFVPEAATQRHLEILAEIAEMLGDASLRERVAAAVDAEQVHAEIARWEPGRGTSSRPRS